MTSRLHALDPTRTTDPLERSGRRSATATLSSPREADTRAANWTTNTSESYFASLGASGPFAPAVNGWLSAAFGRPLDGLELVRGLDTALHDAGAEAATMGQRVALGSHLHEDLSDARSMGIIAHEVAHALGAPGPRAGPVDRPGDPGEARATEAGERARGSLEQGRPPPRLSPADGGRAAIHRYNIYFSFDLGLLDGVDQLLKATLPKEVADPVVAEFRKRRTKHAVHETLTALALQQMLGRRSQTPTDSLWDSLQPEDVRPGDGFDDPKKMGGQAVQDLLRGVRLPDDPRGDLHGKGMSAATTRQVKQLARWLVSFSRDMIWDKLVTWEWNAKLAGAGNLSTIAKETVWNKLLDELDLPRDSNLDLTYQSHYGKQQFLHSMKSGGGLSREDVKKQALDWAGFLIDISRGTQSGSNQVPGTGPIMILAQRFFSGDYNGGDKRFRTLTMRRRAVGALMHLIQDSFAGGHTERAKQAGSAVKDFGDYRRQDEADHAAKDRWGPGANLAMRIINTHGASEALEHCTKVLQLLDQGDAKSSIIDYLDRKVFKLD